MKLFKLVTLKLKSYFRKPTLLLVLAAFLLVLWAILNFTSTNTAETFVLPIGIVDLDHTNYSDLILQRVSRKDTISIQTTSMEEGLKQVSTGKLEAVYILKEGLMDKILDDDLSEIIEIIKSPVSLSAEIIEELFAAEVMRLSSNADAADIVLKQYAHTLGNNPNLWQDAWKATDAYWEPSPIITVDYGSTSQVSGQIENQEITNIKDNLSEILLLTLITFSILIGSSSLLGEKNNGIIKRIISTGTPLWIYLLSNVLTLVIIHVVGLVLVMTFTNQIHNLTGNLAFYTIYMVWISILGLLIVAFTKKMQHLLIIIPFVTLLSGLLVWKTQVYNSLTTSLWVLTILSLAMLMVAIVSFKRNVF